MENEFTEWFEANEKRFSHGQFDEKQIAYSAWLEGKNRALTMPAVSKRSKQLNICKPPKFQDWLSENFKQRTEFYYDKNSNNETYSIKEIESQYVMKFRTNI